MSTSAKQKQKVVGVFHRDVFLQDVVQAERILPVVRFSTTAADNVADRQSVHLMMMSSEDHLGSVKSVAVVVVGTVFESFLLHSPDVDGVGSNDDHEAGDGFVAKASLSKFPAGSTVEALNRLTTCSSPNVPAP